MVHLSFFIARLRVQGRAKNAEVYLRFKAASDSRSGGEEVSFAERMLSSFCFPLGPEAVQPKEVLASEVRAHWEADRSPASPSSAGQPGHDAGCAPPPAQEYTFLLTHSDGKRYYGFCRQILPPPPPVGSKLRYPQVLCIIAEYPWCNLFFKVRRGADRPPLLPTPYASRVSPPPRPPGWPRATSANDMHGFRASPNSTHAMELPGA